MIGLSAYWGCEDARNIDLYMMGLTPRRYRRAMAQLSREIAKQAYKGAFSSRSHVWFNQTYNGAMSYNSNAWFNQTYNGATSYNSNAWFNQPYSGATSYNSNAWFNQTYNGATSYNSNAGLNLAQQRDQRVRQRKIRKGYLPYRNEVWKNNQQAIFANMGDNELDQLETDNWVSGDGDRYLQDEVQECWKRHQRQWLWQRTGWNNNPQASWLENFYVLSDQMVSTATTNNHQRLVGQQASVAQQKQWALGPSKRIQARVMQQLGLRRDPSSKEKRPVSQTWIRQHISQLHGLSLLLALNDRDNGAQSVLTNWLQRERFTSDPQWVRAIAAAVVAIN